MAEVTARSKRGAGGILPLITTGQSVDVLIATASSS